MSSHIFLRFFSATSARRRCLALSVILLAAGSALAAPQGATKRISKSSSGTQSNGHSQRCAISADGRFVAFESAGSNLVAGDNNGTTDIFVHELSSAVTSRVSVSTSGQVADDISGGAAISADGRFVSFCSRATDLVPGDTNGFFDIFVRDRVLGTTTRVSVSSSGAQGNGDCSVGLYLSSSSALSADGRFIAFHSLASNLVPGDANGSLDVFVHDRQTGATSLISKSSTGVEGDATSYYAVLSDDARYVAFASDATNLVPLDSNYWGDVFLHDRQTGTTTRVSVGTSGVQGHLGGYGSTISGDGRFIGFTSRSSNLVAGDSNQSNDAYVHDRVTGVTELVSRSTSGSVGDLTSGPPFLSADGRFAAFQSEADNLVPGDNNAAADFFVRDRLTGATARVSVSASGVEGNAHSYTVHSRSLSADGRVVAFVSSASNLVSGDTNGVWDVFVYERAPASPTRYCAAKINSKGCTPAISTSGTPAVSGSNPFLISGANVLNHKRSVLFYGLAPSHVPFKGGTLCTAPPLARTPVQDSGGSPPPDNCSGALSFDFNARIRAGLDPHLVPGTVIYAQYVYEDQASSSALGLTDAVVFTIQP